MKTTIYVSSGRNHTNILFKLYNQMQGVKNFIIPPIVLLSSIQPEAETLDFSTHALPRNLLKIFQPHEHKGSIVKQPGNDVEGCRSEKVLVQPNMRVFLQYSVIILLVVGNNKTIHAPNSRDCYFYQLTL